MRPQLRNPVDSSRLRTLLPLAETLFRCTKKGGDYAEPLHQLSVLQGKAVTPGDISAAFGSTSAEEFAKELAVDGQPVPDDLQESELLELLAAIVEGDCEDAILQYGLRCLEVYTGNNHISVLIFWPEQYFGADPYGRELTPAEMLAVAMRNKPVGKPWFAWPVHPGTTQ